MGATVTREGHERQQRMTSLARRAFGSVARIVVGVPIVSLFAASVLLLVFGTTTKGRIAGLCGSLLGAALFCIVGYWNEPWFRKRGRVFCAGLMAASLLFYSVLVILAPNGGSPHGRVRNCYLNRQAKFSRYALANVVPEVDQLGIGIRLLPLRDPHARSEARTMRSVLLPMYAALDQDDDFHALGSAMGLAYRELFRVPFRTGHYYAVVPDTDENERLPCLIFLHGMGGNMKPYIWVLSRLNSRVRCVVLAPTFGIGNWDKPGGAELVVSVAREAVATLPVDREQIFLLGYSNGAMGVTRAVIQEPALFRGLMYLSPVTEDNLFQTPEFLRGHETRSIVFIHGGQDRRIPRDFVQGTVGSLGQLGCNVSFRVYEDADHFVLFSRPDSVLNDIAICLTGRLSAKAALENMTTNPPASSQ